MGIKKYTPYTPSRRNMTGLDFTEITKNAPEKSLTVSLKKNSGRNNQGKITVRHHGGGSRRKYRIIDFKRNKDNIPATVLSIEYDPNRTANIALICYADGQKAYILAPQGLKVGQKIMNGEHAEARLGNCLPLSLIPIGTEVHNVELYPGAGAQMVRSAGVAAQLMAKEGKYATLRLPSGEMRMVPINCRATIGVVGNGEHSLVNIGKAGRKRHMGIRPTVRGSVMNPNDHPHGGGEGRAPYPGAGAQMVRSAGVAAQLMAKEGKYATLRLPSGEMRMVPINCRATIGVVGNGEHSLVNIGKAGRKRHMGIRPTVRGSVMNPNDHPHGGGEGRAPVGRPGPCTPWGKPALGLKTRSKKKASNKLIVRRRDGKALSK